MTEQLALLLSRLIETTNQYPIIECKYRINSIDFPPGNHGTVRMEKSASASIKQIIQTSQ